MPIRLPDTLARYFAAANAHDAESMSALFPSAAVVRDEGREHRGLAAIRRWIEETFEKYDYTVEPRALEERGGQSVVTGLVSGSFPGSPVNIGHEFTLEDGKINRLEIG